MYVHVWVIIGLDSRVLDNLNGDYYGVDDRLICILGRILLCSGVVIYVQY
jgi:hypothetical protein